MKITVKPWHIGVGVAAVVLLIVLLVVFLRRREPMTPCPPVPAGDILTSFTQDSNCMVTCQTSDPNATVMRDTTGACRSTCKAGFVKSATTGACSVSEEVSKATIDNLKLQLMNLTDPMMKAQMSAQIASMEGRLQTPR